MTGALKPYPAYRDSGVPWLGEVPVHWEVRRLGQMGRLSKGNGGNKEDETLVGIPCVRYGDLYTTHSYFIEQTRSFVSKETAKNYTPIAFGDALFATSGETIDEIGKSAVNLMRTDACCGGDVILFRPENDTVASYMGYALDCRSSAAQKAAMGRGITVMHIYTGQLKRLLVPVPPLSEQVTIARYLDHVSERIDFYISAKERLIALLNEKKQAIIDRTVTRGLDPNASMKRTGIDWMPEVPAHWEVRRLGQMGRLSKGSGGSKEDETSGGIPCVRYGDLYTTHSYFIERTRSFISEETSKNYTPIFFGDVLFASSGETIDEIGKSAVNLMRTAVCCGADVILFRLQNDAVARYMGYALDCHSSAAQKAAMGRGITVMHIYAGQLKRLPVPFPPLSEQAAIVEHLERSTTAIDAATGRARRQIDLLREYRERLINDVVTGKLDVREARLDTAPDVDALEKAGQAPLPRAAANTPAIP